MTNGFEPKAKKPGDLIIAAFHSTAIPETPRLENSFTESTNKSSFQSSLTIEEAVTVKDQLRIGTEQFTTKLEVKEKLKLEPVVAVNKFSINGTLADNSAKAVPKEQVKKTNVGNTEQELPVSFNSAKKLQVSDKLTVEGFTQIKGGLQLGEGLAVAQFSDTISPLREPSLVVVPTEQAIIAYINSILKKFGLFAPGEVETFDLGDGVTLEVIHLPEGSFLMGSSANEPEHEDNERPQHTVIVPAFGAGKYPVTQKQWQAVASYPQVSIRLKTNPSHFKGDSRPVEQVNWHEAQEFCARLTYQFSSQLKGRKFCLPSEAQWEYACRAGTTSKYYFGNNDAELGDYAWYKDNSGGETHPVGTKKPNNWQLYDMVGNVSEWCEDSWHENYHNALSNGSAWENGDTSNLLLRGGSWDLYQSFCRSAHRSSYSPDFKYHNFGFRVVCC
ncbi:MAG: formylglycine-generating enzyme family protein [Symploca sp. SIO1C2]|nr:formylglycine-generating enzyme family protein [Symploca sp. SIO1C2]